MEDKRQYLIDGELKDKVEQLAVDLQITKSLFGFIDDYITNIPSDVQSNNSLYKLQYITGKTCQMVDTSYVVLTNLHRITKELDKLVEEMYKCKVNK